MNTTNTPWVTGVDSTIRVAEASDFKYQLPYLEDGSLWYDGNATPVYDGEEIISKELVHKGITYIIFND